MDDRIDQTGSSTLRWGLWGEAAGDEEHSESVVVGVAEAAGDAAVEFDQPVDGLGPAVVGAAGVEVGQERRLPLFQCASEPGDLGDGAGGEGVEDLGGDCPARCWCGLVVDRADLLGALPGDLDGDVVVVGSEGGVEAGALPVGEILGAGAQDVPDPVQRVTGAAAVAVDLLLDPASDIIDHAGGQLDDVEGVQHGDGVSTLGRFPVPDIDLSEQQRWAELLQGVTDQEDEYRAQARRLQRLRSSLLAVLLSGEHEIPESYDELMGVAS